MPSYIYKALTTAEKNIPKAENESKKWFRNAATAVSSVNANKLMKDRPRLLPQRRLHRVHIGRMIMFFYDPKTKDKLPYFDTFPLVIPINMYRNGFLGLNLHYLPRKLRAQLLDSLYNVYQDDYLDERKKLVISYNLMQNAMRIRFYTPTIKRYLVSNLRSKIYLVDPQEWDLTLMLPTERFVGASKHKVWADSMSSLGLGVRR